MAGTSRIALAIGLVSAGLISAGWSVQARAADVVGQVIDPATGSALPGATIRVTGTDRSAVADERGEFAIRNLPDGPVSLLISYVGFPDTTRDGVTTGPSIYRLNTIERDADIVVTGTRAAERRALQAKRTSAVVQDTLNANDVGKLPDQNVAEAIRRLPGVSVANDQGEGRYVVIRGGNPNLANVTLNGQTAPAPEPESRQVKLDDIPSSLIGSVDVIKTRSADRDANAIAGEVDINTLSAFDRKKGFAYGRFGYGLYDLNSKSPYDLEGTVGTTFSDRTFGIVVAGNYSNRPIRSENIQGSANWVANATTGNVPTPDDFRLRDYNLTRQRYGGVVNLDWRPSSSVSLFLRTIYSKFKDAETRDQFRIEIPVATATNGTSTGFLVNPTAAGGSFTRARGSRLIRSRTEDSNTLTFQGGGKFDFGGPVLEVEATYAKAKKTDPIRSEFNFRTSSTAFAGTYDLTNFLINVTPTAPAYNPALFLGNSVNYDTRQAVEDLYQARADLKLPLGDSDNFIKVGAKYLDRHKTNNRDITTYNLATTVNLGLFANVEPLFLYGGRYPFGPRVPYAAAQAYVTANPATLTLNSASTIGNSLVNDYDVKERIYAGYAMASLRFGDVSIVPGVRVERTEGTFASKRLTATSTVNDGFSVFGGNSYTDVFPGVNLKWDATSRLVVRGALTTAIGRPDYNQLAPFVSVDANAGTVSQGNPNLKALKSVNGDASIEFYLPGQGILSVAGFYKSIDNPIYTATSTVTGGTFGGVTLPTAQVTQPINVSNAKIYGIEANLQAQFTFLPAPFDGFGVGLNYTHVEGSATGAPGRAGTVPLILQSPDVWNAQLFYEKGRLSARVAYSYRAAYLDTLGNSPLTDQYNDSNGSLDVRGSFQILPQVTIYAEATNLTNAPWRRYVGIKSQIIENEIYGYGVKGGIQLAF